MALPAGGSVQWPPPQHQATLADARAWAAWWSGDIAALIETAGTDTDGLQQVWNRNERRFQFDQLLRRRFWQRRGDTRDVTSATRPAHAPLAGDIAATSADLLFGEAPDLTIPESQTRDGRPKRDRNRDAVQDRLETLVEQVGLWALLLEAAEVAAGTGGVYLRAVWDADVADHPLSSAIDQGHAAPEFRYGRLAAVTFWEEVHRDGAAIWRHLERHEPGRVLHGLYEGAATILGDPRPLGALPATADLDPEIVLPAELPHPLLVTYVPNVRPYRRHGCDLGRSDFAGSEGLLDLLDEVWTSLGRDFRLGQARIVTAIDFLQAAGTKASDGKLLDVDTELFTGLNIAELEQVSDPLKLFQPDVRVDQHAAAITNLVRQIVGAAGYAPQTFGIDIEGAAETGAAERIKLRKTLNTVNRKRGYWTRGIVEHVETLLAVDAAVFGGPGWLTPTLDWPQLDDDPKERAETAQLWRSAQAMSVPEAVRARNPRWTEEEVDAEVALIEGEAKAAAQAMIDALPDDDEDQDQDQDEGRGGS